MQGKGERGSGKPQRQAARQTLCCPRQPSAVRLCTLNSPQQRQQRRLAFCTGSWPGVMVAHTAWPTCRSSGGRSPTGEDRHTRCRVVHVCGQRNLQGREECALAGGQQPPAAQQAQCAPRGRPPASWSGRQSWGCPPCLRGTERVGCMPGEQRMGAGGEIMAHQIEQSLNKPGAAARVPAGQGGVSLAMHHGAHSSSRAHPPRCGRWSRRSRAG